MSLHGKKILITGASRGIGREVAVTCSKLGATVYLVARDNQKLNETIDALEGEGHKYYIYDLEDISGLEKFIGEIVKENGVLNGLVHCAGIADMRSLMMTHYDFLHKIMLTNFYAFIELSRVYSKKKNNAGGSIVVISSISSLKGNKSKTAYCASKSAVDGAIRSMSTELHMKHIRINSIIAGFIKTDMFNMYIQDVGENQLETQVLSRQFMGLGETFDIANAAAFLLSDASKFITGTGMVVDGGYLV